MNDWDDNTPIYLQLRNTVVRQIVQGRFAEGEVVPSVRQVAADEKINPITVSKAYQMLVDEGLLEKRRGVGMFVCPGAQAKSLDSERKAFIAEEWPRVVERIELLGLDPRQLLKGRD